MPFKAKPDDLTRRASILRVKEHVFLGVKIANEGPFTSFTCVSEAADETLKKLEDNGKVYKMILKEVR